MSTSQTAVVSEHWKHRGVYVGHLVVVRRDAEFVGAFFMLKPGASEVGISADDFTTHHAGRHATQRKAYDAATFAAHAAICGRDEVRP